MIGRTSALVKLVRSEADFVILGVALAASGGHTERARLLCRGFTLLLAIAATAVVVAMYVAGGVGFPKPDLEKWLEKPDENRPAIRSPEMGTAIKRRRARA